MEAIWWSMYKGVRRVLVLLIVNGKLDAHHKAKVNLFTLENTVSKIIDLFRIIKNVYVVKNVKLIK